jgi:hypothetical protein
MLMLNSSTVIVFGGQDKMDRGLDDVVVLDLKDKNSLSWHRPVVSGAGPSPRWNVVAKAQNDKLYVFGGMNNQNKNKKSLIAQSSFVKRLW